MGGQKRWSAPPEIPHFASLLGRWLGSALLGSSSAVYTHPFLFLWDVAWRHGKVTVSPGHGADKSRIAVLWSQTPADPAWCNTSVRSSHVESSPASELAAWHDTDNLAFRGLSTIVFHCLGLRDRDNQPKEVATVLSLSQGLHGCDLGEHPPSCLCPSSHMELSQGGELLSCLKNLLFFHTFVIDTVAVTVCSLFCCFFSFCYLNP